MIFSESSLATAYRKLVNKDLLQDRQFKSVAEAGAETVVLSGIYLYGHARTIPSGLRLMMRTGRDMHNI